MFFLCRGPLSAKRDANTTDREMNGRRGSYNAIVLSRV